MADQNKTLEFQRRAQPITDELVKELRALVPRDWQMAMLQLDVAFSPIRGERSIKHRLWNPLTDREVRDFPEALFQATNALHAIFAEYQQAWVRSLVMFRGDPSGGFECEFNYHYADTQRA